MNLDYFMVEDKDRFIIHGVIALRSKGFEGVILRFLTRSESSAESALADGIGLRIFIDREQALRLAPILYKWFVQGMKIEGIIEIENKSFLGKKEVNELARRLIETGKEIKKERRTSSGDTFTPKEGFIISEKKSKGSNPASAGDFKALLLKGSLRFSDKDETLTFESISSHARQFEIQLVLPDDKNEAGEGNHHIYEAKKCIIARTRLDGWCPKSAFDEFVKDAAEKSGLDPKQIRYFLIEKPNADFVEMKKNGKLIYLAFSVYERWRKLGFVDNDTFSEIERARSLNRK